MSLNDTMKSARDRLRAAAQDEDKRAEECDRAGQNALAIFLRASAQETEIIANELDSYIID